MIVVVVGNKILDRILRKELPELLIELRRERFIVSHHKHGAVHALYDLRHCEGLTAAGYAEQHLMLDSLVERAYKLFDSLRLIALRKVITLEFEVH